LRVSSSSAREANRNPGDGCDELTASEQLIWTGQLLEPAAPLYNMALAIEITRPLDVSRFRHAFQQLVDGTDALRTSFVEDGGHTRRVVRRHVSGAVDFLRLPEQDQDEASLAAVLESRTRRCFSLDGPLFDCALIERRPDRFVWYLNQHHLITDAWSVGLLHRRLSALYADGETAPATATSPNESAWPQFAVFAEHQRTLRGSDRLSRAIEYWDTVAAGASRTAPLYGDTSPGSGRTRRVRVRLDAERKAALRRRAAAPPFRGLTSEQSHFQLFATVLLAWLHRVSDTRSVAIGIPWHNRSTALLRETAGLFVELFPLRATVTDGETFVSLGAKVANQMREDMRHVVPGASESPGARAFSVVLNYITARLGDFAGVPVRADWIHSGSGDGAHRVRLQVHDFDVTGGPVLDFDLDEATFCEQERAWAVRHFLALFDALVAEPEREIARVVLTSFEEEQSFAPRGEEMTTAESVLALVESSARLAPDAIAVRDEDRFVTYAALRTAADALAVRLQRAGVGPESVVGIALDRGVEMVVALLAVLRSRAAFVPLDPAYPDARLAFVTADAGATLVVTTSALVGRVRTWGASPVLVDQTSEADDAPESVALSTPAPGSLAYVLYTSGSTGSPKGVEVTHRALADYVTWAAHRYADAPHLAWPLFTSLSFDLTLTSIFVPLASRGTIVAYAGDPGESALLVRRVFEDNLVDVVKLTPSHLTLVRDLDLSRSRVRRLIVGGENLTRAAALSAFEALGGRAEVLNEYGPTEATVACTLHRFDPATDQRVSVPIGRPASNVHVHVLGAGGHPVPCGVSGEICIGGPRVARGYRDRPDSTAQAFVPDPCGRDARLYRTGDVGRWMKGGTLEYLGRRDHQVKVRGVRIELEEIEAALVRHPAIEACAVRVAVVPRDAHQPRCRLCGLEGRHPEAHLDSGMTCAVCRRFETERANVARYFGTMDDLARILSGARRQATSDHDCLMLYSGGKDSTYALLRLVEMGARPLVMLFDNGFISGQGKDNVRRVVDALGLELVVCETVAMPAIFAESLKRFSNVCNGCFKAIYTMAINLAAARGIRHVITGLSRGQIFETRLADLYRQGIYDPDEVDRVILAARKAYHRMDDAVSRALDVQIFETDAALDQIQFVDFYRYCDASLDEILRALATRTPWIRPTDTGRSTNCLINQAGIFVHTSERGFHNYAMPYSWDVRLGHKARDAAIAELDDTLDMAAIGEMLDRVGYHPRTASPDETRLVAYYSAREELRSSELREYLQASLPRDVVPSNFIRLDRLPLTESGKVDRLALPELDTPRISRGTWPVAPRTDIEALLADLWSDALKVRPIGVHDDFFELGGNSMHCIQIVAAARSRGVVVAPRDLFAYPTIAGLAMMASHIRSSLPERHVSATDAELSELMDEFGGEPQPRG
jgi:amino acid adenylation domain-containing protein